jgi:hypothetical protein
VSINSGIGDLAGLPLMKFTLTYDGELRSNKPKAKWAIRRQLDPQLEELWRVDPVMINLQRRRMIPANQRFIYREEHHSTVASKDQSQPDPNVSLMNLCETIRRGPWGFLPLIRNSLALQCGLKITFLRKEGPGKVYQGGDIDNRLKTLFDALSVPKMEQLPAPSDGEKPELIFCLLEDDSLIAGLNIETGRLLSRSGASESEVRLIIEVDVRVVQARLYNQIFLGD